MIAKEFADNKVDVIIYAVERSLDSYKFNLLHNKQLFINQLKTNTLGSRTTKSSLFFCCFLRQKALIGRFFEEKSKIIFVTQKDCIAPFYLCIVKRKERFRQAMRRSELV